MNDMKEVIGLVIQLIGMSAMFCYVLPRQIRDLYYKEDDVRAEQMKRRLLASTLIVLAISIPPLIRLTMLVVFGLQWELLDAIVFWCNRILFAGIALSAVAIYRNNKRVISIEQKERK